MPISKEPSKLAALSADERASLIDRLLKAQNSLCYIDGKIINLQVHKVDIDHIIGFSRGGPDDESNWALAHQSCNRAKGARDLLLQRRMYRYKSDVEKHGSSPSSLMRNFTVHDALEEFFPNRQVVGVKRHADSIQLSYNDGDEPVTQEYQLIADSGDPKILSFVGMIPFSCLHHDPEINPRSIVDLEPMIEEFYNGNPQLQPSLATLDFAEPSGTGKVMLFDGQHKAAAQLYLHRPCLFARVFINPDRNKLKQTNYRAHTRLAQIHFPQLINDRVGADLFQEEFDRYLQQADQAKKSEQSFFNEAFEPQQRSEFRGYFQSFLRYEILSSTEGDESNQILGFVETIVARSRRYPLAYDTLQRTFLDKFVFLSLAGEPLDETIQMRELERQNLVKLMNMFVEEVLSAGRFELGRGIYRIEETLLEQPDAIPESHLRAYRICRKPAMVVWCEELCQAIQVLLNTRLRYKTPSWSQQRPLWLEMQEDDWIAIRKMIQAIRDHKIWGERTNGEILSSVTSNTQRDWQSMLLEGKLPGREEQLLPKLDQNFIFKAAQ